MRMWKFIAITSFVCSLFNSPVYAETTFITDKIVVDIFADKFQRGIAIKSLPSGTVVEVVETDGDFAKVRTGDNKEGWLHSKYLSTEKPAQLSYLQLMAKHKKLDQELIAAREKLKGVHNAEKEIIAAAGVRKELKQAKSKIAKLEKSVQNKTKALTTAEKELKTFQQNVTELQDQLSQQDQTTKTSANPEKPDKPAPSGKAQTATTPNITTRQNAPIDQPGLDMPIPLKWTLIALLLSTILGIYLGYNWLDAKIRKRHGGVRIR